MCTCYHEVMTTCHMLYAIFMASYSIWRHKNFVMTVIIIIIMLLQP